MIRVDPRVLLGGLLLLGVGVGLLGKSRAPKESSDSRLSTFIYGRDGGSGLAAAVSGMGLVVERLRSRSATRRLSGSTERTVLVILDPSIPLSPIEIRELIDFSKESSVPVDLVIVGTGTRKLMRCFGYQPVGLEAAIPLERPLGAVGDTVPWSEMTLEPVPPGGVFDSSRVLDLGVMECLPPVIGAVDTLVRNANGDALVLELRLSGSAMSVVLAAEESLFRNYWVRNSWSGEWAVKILATEHERVIFDEYHHGFSQGGSLGSYLLTWSRETPLGWLVWQMVIIGMMALGFASPRFGPLWQESSRKRRSVLEHVEALATALRAAGGHEAATRLLIRGLHRRLALSGAFAKGEEYAWLRSYFRSRTLGPRAMAALKTIEAAGLNPQQKGVLEVAVATEDLWEELRR